jgi:hypothetical protein
MWVLHNLVNAPQRLTSSRPNPKMQYLNMKMIYQVQETCKSIFDYWPKCRYCIFFIKNSTFCRPTCRYCIIWYRQWQSIIDWHPKLVSPLAQLCPIFFYALDETILSLIFESIIHTNIPKPHCVIFIICHGLWPLPFVTIDKQWLYHCFVHLWLWIPNGHTILWQQYANIP